MGESTRHSVGDEGFELRVAPGWEAERDLDEGGVDVWHPDGPGDLHLVGFASPADTLADPAEELYAFLNEQEIELEEDEVEDFDLEGHGELAVCEYLTEDEEGEGAYWLLGVAALPGTLVFAHYTCAPGEQEQERTAILEMLRSIRPTGDPLGGS
jgi:hypothetical protein